MEVFLMTGRERINTIIEKLIENFYEGWVRKITIEHFTMDSDKELDDLAVITIEIEKEYYQKLLETLGKIVNLVEIRKEVVEE